MRTEDRIPEWCKKDCYFRDKKAKYMPACQYGFRLKFDSETGKCLTYKKIPGLKRGKVKVYNQHSINIGDKK